MAKTITEIKSLARGHTETAINVLASIMNQPEAAPAARVAAANSLLDRGWGKAAQPVTGDDGEPGISVIHTIRRIIVDPRHSDSESVSPSSDPSQV